MSSRSSSDLEAILRAGGAGRVALLKHCVKSVTMEPLFLFLVGEYATKPTATAALALYDVFCAPQAFASVKAASALPPRDLRLPAAIAALRRQVDSLASQPTESEALRPVVIPSRDIFDGVVAAIRNDPDGPLVALANRYDPQLDPFENLPGRRMTAGQRHFVDMIWRPRLRPRLVNAGFWPVATID
jgi:hypothetical protein